MALILSLETGTDICSAGLARDGRLISLRESGEGKNHARSLALYVREMLEEIGIEPRELDAVAVGRGPGSYTGLRVGVSLAKGLSYGLNIPLIAVDSLQSLARVAWEDCDAGILDLETLSGCTLAPMIDARRMEVYTRLYDSELNPLTEVEALILDATSLSDRLATGKVVVFGDGAAKAAGAIDHPNLHDVPVLPSARGMAALAEKAYEQGDFVDTAYFEPFYLKDFVVIPSKKNFFAEAGKK